MGFTEIYCYVDDFLKELGKRTALSTNLSSKRFITKDMAWVRRR